MCTLKTTVCGHFAFALQPQDEQAPLPAAAAGHGAAHVLEGPANFLQVLARKCFASGDAAKRQSIAFLFRSRGQNRIHSILMVDQKSVPHGADLAPQGRKALQQELQDCPEVQVAAVVVSHHVLFSSPTVQDVGLLLDLACKS